jgi:uncharacterized membrane protein
VSLELADPQRAHDAAERARRREQRRRAPRPPGGSSLLASRAGRVLAAIVAALLLFTVVGLVTLWPGGETHPLATGGSTASSLPATVKRQWTQPCAPSAQPCRHIAVELKRGGKTVRTAITLGPIGTTPNVPAGSAVRISPVPHSALVAARGGSVEPYSFDDFDRHAPLVWLAVAFAVLAIAFGRWRGVLSIVGMGLSVLLVVLFLVPAILAGSSPLLVALVGSLAVMFITLALTSGVGPQSLAAAVGIGATLLLASALAQLLVDVSHLTSSDDALNTFAVQEHRGFSLAGVVLAGMVVGALGVLADTAVTQASAVMALRRANPRSGARALYGGAIAVGRDHLSATIHTLVLAYVGAALPLLLLLQGANAPLADALNSQAIAEPIIATLVGSIALLAAVPLTTAIASLLVARMPAASLGEGHAHAH